jgi:hypothetical protein
MSAKPDHLPRIFVAGRNVCRGALLDEFVATVKRNLLRWLFEDRRSGHIVVAQWPNIALWVWIAASAVNWLANPGGRWGTALGVTGTVALALWAVDEVLRGVNPWRRILGSTVLIFVAIRSLVVAL